MDLFYKLIHEDCFRFRDIIAFYRSRFYQDASYSYLGRFVFPSGFCNYVHLFYYYVSYRDKFYYEYYVFWYVYVGIFFRECVSSGTWYFRAYVYDVQRFRFRFVMSQLYAYLEYRASHGLVSSQYGYRISLGDLYYKYGLFSIRSKGDYSYALYYHYGLHYYYSYYG